MEDLRTNHVSLPKMHLKNQPNPPFVYLSETIDISNSQVITNEELI